MTWGCPVVGCDFHVDATEGDWQEEMVSHVRWLHIAPGDFGPAPAPSLTALVVSGLIEPDEYEALRAGQEQAKPDPPLRAAFALLAITFMFGLAAFNVAASSMSGAAKFETLLSLVLGWMCWLVLRA